MLTVLGRATSVNVQRVMWTIGELGLAHVRKDVGGAFGGNDAPEFRAKNPHGLVPTVELGDGRVMWESSAIVRQLARSDPERRLWPEGGQDELSADMWAQWAVLNINVPIATVFVALIRSKIAERNWTKINEAAQAAHKGLLSAEAVLSERAFLATDHLTIADIDFGVMLYRYYEMEIERPDLPAVAAYYRRLTERPAYEEHVMVDFNGLRAEPR